MRTPPISQLFKHSALILSLTLSACGGDKPNDLPTPVLATVTTGTASAITTTTAILDGNVTGDGGASVTERGICYNATANPTTQNNKVSSGSGVGNFSVNLTGLVPGQTYYVRAYAINSVGTTYGNEINFTALLPNVKICNQVWMLENLDVEKYRNGDPIPQVTDATQWTNLTTGAWCYYNNDAANGAIYGKLYNWYAVNDPRGLAPQGWHVASDEEWTTLTNCLGGESIAGGKLKEAGTSHWIIPNIGATNSSGFTAIPGGGRSSTGNFSWIGEDGFWMTSTPDLSTFIVLVWARALGTNAGSIYRGTYGKANGFSVRCVKD